jgi:excisionase family DNA binding protein
MPDPLLDYSGGAAYLATTERHVRALQSDRKLTSVRVGRLVRFRREDLDRYVAKNTVAASR